MIRLVVQSFDYRLPWKQRGMTVKIGSGFVIEGSRVLTNAHNVVDAKYVELTRENSARRYPARVEFIGHDCDLATLKPLDLGFFRNVRPLPLGGLPGMNCTVSTYGFPLGGRRVSVTEGVVSRIQTDIYTLTGADEHLVVQTDAAINPGNSGGPVVQGGKVVGVAFQGLRQAENIGYMIPTTVIRHFLADIADGTYNGFGSLGFSYVPVLHNPAFRAFCKVPEGTEGVVVRHVLLNSSVQGVLRRGDVLVRIGSYDIDNDGMIRAYGLRVDLSEALEQKQLGEEIELLFFRDGKKHAARVAVSWNRPPLAYAKQYDKPPRYVVYAGLVFTVLSRNVLETWGPKWVRAMPAHLRYVFIYASELNKDPARKDYVILTGVLADPVNTYASDFKDCVLTEINGVPIRALSDIPGAIKAGEGPFCVFRFMDRERPLVMDRARSAERHGAILRKYGVPSDRRLEQER